MSGSSRTPAPIVRWFTALAVLVVAWYLLMAWAYALAPSFLDHFEPSIALGALRVLAGEQAFHDPKSAAQYASIYGPHAYLVSALWVAMWPDVVAGSKLAGAAAAVAFCLLFVAACTRRLGLRVAVMQAALTLGGVLLFGHIGYWNRPEPLQLFGVALALFSLTCKRPYAAAACLGVALALLVNLKVHSPIFVLPVIAVLMHQRQWRVLTSAAVLAVIGTLAPFLATDVFSLPNYVAMLSAAAHHPFGYRLLALNVVYLVFLALPLLAASVFGPRPPSDGTGPYRLTLCGVGVLLCVMGSKAGAGPHHLLPLLPLMAWSAGGPMRAFVSTGSSRPLYVVTAALWIVVLLALGARMQWRIWTSVTHDQGHLVIADLKAIRATYADSSIQMAPADIDQAKLYWLRPALRPHNPVDFLDATTWMDMHMSGRPLPHATHEALERGLIDVWLVPKGGVPFSLRSAYPARGRIFSPEFRQSFERGYQRAHSTAYFDVYLPRARSAGSLER